MDYLIDYSGEMIVLMKLMHLKTHFNLKVKNLHYYKEALRHSSAIDGDVRKKVLRVRVLGRWCSRLMSLIIFINQTKKHRRDY